MATVPNTETQARILQEIVEANARKRKVEEDIRSADAASNAFIDKAALRIIETYKSRSLVPGRPLN